MKRNITLYAAIAFSAIAFKSTAQTGPEYESWLINQGEIGQYYIQGNTTPQSNGHTANVKHVYYTGTDVYINSSGIPAYPIGPYMDGNPSQAGDKDYLFRIPLNPVPASNNQATGLGQTGVLINGVPVYNYSDAMSYNNQGIWNRVAPFFENDGFDCSKGHPAPDMQSTLDDGYYHHHQNPVIFSSSANPASNVCDTYPSTGLYTLDANTHSPLIGYAFDGYPIYGSFGYANTDGTGGIVRIQSSYQKRNITDRTTLPDGTVLNQNQYGPAIDATYPLGAYEEDFEYVQGSGHLDEHNGRFCVTPEYPQGTYAYFATIDADYNSAYPFFIGPTYYGEVATDNLPNGPNGGGSVTLPGGATEYTGPANTVEDIFNHDMMIYPNPAQDVVTVLLQQDYENISVELLDMTGRKVKSLNIIHGQNYLNVSDLNNGVYILAIRKGEEIHTQRLIKQ